MAQSKRSLQHNGQRMLATSLKNPLKLEEKLNTSRLKFKFLATLRNFSTIKARKADTEFFLNCFIVGVDSKTD